MSRIGKSIEAEVNSLLPMIEKSGIGEGMPFGSKCYYKVSF